MGGLWSGGDRSGKDQVWGRWGRGRECEERQLELVGVWGGGGMET